MLESTNQYQKAINTRMQNSQTTKLVISKMFDQYRPVALRGQILYFVICTMQIMHPMYYWSLDYFKNIYEQNIRMVDQSQELQAKLSAMITNITVNIYKNIVLGLFSKDIAVFQFLLAFEVDKESSSLEADLWHKFLRSPEDQ